MTRRFITNVMMYSVNREVLSFKDTAAVERYLASGNEIHLLLAETRFPGSNGFDLLRFVKNGHPQIICIAMSSEPADEAQARKLGSDAFLAKPFMLKDLFAIVQHFVVEKDTASFERPA